MRVECRLEIRPGKKVKDIVLVVEVESDSVYEARQLVTKQYGHVYVVKTCKPSAAQPRGDS